MLVARELVARGDRRSIVLADLIVDSVRADVRRMVQAEMQAETGWGKTLWLREIGKAVADGWANGMRKGHADGKAEGHADGKAEALSVVLRARRIELTREQSARIESCRDHAQLERWLERASVASDATEIFAR